MMGSVCGSSVVGEVDQRAFFGLLERVGAIGRYQHILLLFMCMAVYLCGGITCITPFLFFQDPYHCPPGIPLTGSCHEHVCSLPATDRVPFIPPPTTHTISTQFGDYRCAEEKLSLGVVMTVIYIGRVVGSGLMMVVGDRYGRLNMFIWSF